MVSTSATVPLDILYPLDMVGIGFDTTSLHTPQNDPTLLWLN